MMNSNLLSSRRCNELLLERITQLECNNLNNTLYNRNETIEINPRSSDIANNVPDQSVCQVLSLTGISVKPEDLQACHHMRKTDGVTIKFKCRKQNHHVLSNRQTIQNKSINLTQKIFQEVIYENMCMKIIS